MASDIHRYYPTRRRTYWGMSLTFWAVAIIFSCVAAIETATGRISFNWLNAAIALAGAVISLTSAQFRYITTSPKGLSYRFGVYSIHTTWDKVIRVDYVKTMSSTKERALMIRDPLITAIPLTQNWTDYHQLIKDIRAYAPHVTGL